MPTSSFSAPSSVSPGVSLVGDRLALSMSSPIRPRINPPAILKAASVMPNSLKIKVPAIENVSKTMKHVHAARTAMWRRWMRFESPVMARKVGTAAMGSTRTKIDVKAINENWSRAIKGVEGVGPRVGAIPWPSEGAVRRLARRPVS